MEIPRSWSVISVPMRVPNFTGLAQPTVVIHEPRLALNEYNQARVAGCSPGLDGADHARTGSLLLAWTSLILGYATDGTLSPVVFQ